MLETNQAGHFGWQTVASVAAFHLPTGTLSQTIVHHVQPFEEPTMEARRRLQKHVDLSSTSNVLELALCRQLGLNARSTNCYSANVGPYLKFRISLFLFGRQLVHLGERLSLHTGKEAECSSSVQHRLESEELFQRDSY
jgi:hypothetical protein